MHSYDLIVISELELQFLDPHNDQRSNEQLFFQWTLSEIFDYFLEFEAFMLSFALSHVPLLF